MADNNMTNESQARTANQQALMDRLKKLANDEAKLLRALNNSDSPLDLDSVENNPLLQQIRTNQEQTLRDLVDISDNRSPMQLLKELSTEIKAQQKAIGGGSVSQDEKIAACETNAPLQFQRLVLLYMAYRQIANIKTQAEFVSKERQNLLSQMRNVQSVLQDDQLLKDINKLVEYYDARNQAYLNDLDNALTALLRPRDASTLTNPPEIRTLLNLIDKEVGILLDSSTDLESDEHSSLATIWQAQAEELKRLMATPNNTHTEVEWLKLAQAAIKSEESNRRDYVAAGIHLRCQLTEEVILEMITSRTEQNNLTKDRQSLYQREKRSLQKLNNPEVTERIKAIQNFVTMKRPWMAEIAISSSLFQSMESPDSQSDTDSESTEIPSTNAPLRQQAIAKIIDLFKEELETIKNASPDMQWAQLKINLSDVRKRLKTELNNSKSQITEQHTEISSLEWFRNQSKKKENSARTPFERLNYQRLQSAILLAMQDINANDSIMDQFLTKEREALWVRQDQLLALASGNRDQQVTDVVEITKRTQTFYRKESILLSHKFAQTQQTVSQQTDTGSLLTNMQQQLKDLRDKQDKLGQEIQTQRPKALGITKTATSMEPSEQLRSLQQTFLDMEKFALKSIEQLDLFKEEALLIRQRVNTPPVQSQIGQEASERIDVIEKKIQTTVATLNPLVSLMARQLQQIKKIPDTDDKETVANEVENRLNQLRQKMDRASSRSNDQPATPSSQSMLSVPTAQLLPRRSSNLEQRASGATTTTLDANTISLMQQLQSLVEEEATKLLGSSTDLNSDVQPLLKNLWITQNQALTGLLQTPSNTKTAKQLLEALAVEAKNKERRAAGDATISKSNLNYHLCQEIALAMMETHTEESVRNQRRILRGREDTALAMINQDEIRQRIKAIRVFIDTKRKKLVEALIDQQPDQPMASTLSQAESVPQSTSTAEDQSHHGANQITYLLNEELQTIIVAPRDIDWGEIKTSLADVRERLQTELANVMSLQSTGHTSAFDFLDTLKKQYNEYENSQSISLAQRLHYQQLQHAALSTMQNINLDPHKDISLAQERSALLQRQHITIGDLGRNIPAEAIEEQEAKINSAWKIQNFYAFDADTLSAKFTYAQQTALTRETTTTGAQPSASSLHQAKTKRDISALYKALGEEINLVKKANNLNDPAFIEALNNLRRQRTEIARKNGIISHELLINALVHISKQLQNNETNITPVEQLNTQLIEHLILFTRRNINRDDSHQATLDIEVEALRRRQTASISRLSDTSQQNAHAVIERISDFYNARVSEQSQNTASATGTQSTLAVRSNTQHQSTADNQDRRGHRRGESLTEKPAAKRRR